jgi:hypothetical protein
MALTVHAPRRCFADHCLPERNETGGAGEAEWNTRTVRAHSGAVPHPRRFPVLNQFCGGALYGRTGRLPAASGGFRPGQCSEGGGAGCCSEGREGLLCESCREGYNKQNDRCVRCDGPALDAILAKVAMKMTMVRAAPSG